MNSINWLVDRIHIGTPDEEVREDIRERLANAQKRGLETDVLTRACFEDIAIARHHHNRADYAWVMGSH